MSGKIRTISKRYALLTAGAVALCVLMGLAGGAQAAPGGRAATVKACMDGRYLDLVTADGQSFANEHDCITYGAQGGTPTPPPPATLTAVTSNCFGATTQACELTITGSGLQPFADIDYCVDDVVPCGFAPMGAGADADGNASYVVVAQCPPGRSIWAQSTANTGELIASEPQTCPTPPPPPATLTAVTSICSVFTTTQACALTITGSGLEPFAEIDYCRDDIVPCGDAPMGAGADADGNANYEVAAQCPPGRSIWAQSTTNTGELIASEPQTCPTL